MTGTYAKREASPDVETRSPWGYGGWGGSGDDKKRSLSESLLPTCTGRERGD